jgi:hypothetical protein
MAASNPRVNEITVADERFSSNLAGWTHLSKELKDWFQENNCVDCESCGDSLYDEIRYVITGDLVRKCVELVGVALRTGQSGALSCLDLGIGSGGGDTTTPLRHNCGATTWSVPEGTPGQAVAWTITCDGCGEERQIIAA